ncbi:hypothetical protein FHG87_007150 [Trinorchestia longiramus]|nr:hypothetical protein FHG87_007150 [Trinorchestia longiramus]
MERAVPTRAVGIPHEAACLKTSSDWLLNFLPYPLRECPVRSAAVTFVWQRVFKWKSRSFQPRKINTTSSHHSYAGAREQPSALNCCRSLWL